MVTTAEPEAEVLAGDTAGTTTVSTTTPPLPLDFVGTAPGATKNPVLETNPVARLPPGTPFTCQVTAVFAEPLTLAVNCCVPKTFTVAVFRFSETTTPPPPPPLEVLMGPLQAARIGMTTMQSREKRKRRMNSPRESVPLAN